MILAHLSEKERRKNVRQVDLARAVKITAAAVEVLRHHAEINVAGAEDVANLAKHFLYAHIGAGIARAVVSGEEQAEFIAGFPALTKAEHPADAPDFDQRADPSDQKEVGHARAPPATIFDAASLAEAGQGFAG